MSNKKLDNLFEKYIYEYPDKLQGTLEFANFQGSLKKIGYNISEEEIEEKISAMKNVIEDNWPEELEEFQTYLQAKGISTFKELSEVNRRLFTNNIDSEEYTLHDIDNMSGYEFERFLVYLFKRIGYEVKHTKRSSDQGADLVLSNNGKLTIVQAKRYSKPVGNKAVQEAVAAIGFYSARKGMVVCNRSFTKSAKALAFANQIRLVDREELSDWLSLFKIGY